VAWESFRRDHGDELVDQGFDRIGEMVHRRRQRLGLTQQHLASLSGIDQSVISRLERGQLRGLRWSRFAKIVGALGGLDESAPIPPWCLGNIGLIGARQRSEPRPSSVADEAPDAGA
jgi:transcriptional regulator with XRE-family HTH domain